MSENYAEYQFIPLKTAKDNKRKVTRKRTQLELKLGESYPPEGHCCSIDASSDGQGVNTYRVLTLGGGRNREESTWKDAAVITEFIIKADDEDVSIVSTSTCNTKGAYLPALQYARMVDAGRKKLIWGGLDLESYRCSDDVHVLEELPRPRRGIGNPLFHVQRVETLANKTLSERGRDLPHQTGPVPSARNGHTLTKIGDTSKAVLFGGISMGMSSAPFSSRFTKSCKDGRFYILDTNTYEWEHIPVPLMQARAYHSANTMETASQYKVILVGGVVFEGSKPAARLPLNEVIILNMDKNLKNFTLEKISLQPLTPFTHNVFVSSHAAVIHENHLLVVGGIQDRDDHFELHKAPKASSTSYSINFEEGTFDALPKTSGPTEIFATAGHSLHILQNDNTLLVLGGSSKQISLLSDRNFEPENCAYIPCTIASCDSDSDAEWIQCENANCKKWYHTFCIKLSKIPKGKYQCAACKK